MLLGQTFMLFVLLTSAAAVVGELFKGEMGS